MGLFTKVAAKISPVVKQGAKDAQRGKQTYKFDDFAKKGRDTKTDKKKSTSLNAPANPAIREHVRFWPLSGPATCGRKAMA